MEKKFNLKIALAYKNLPTQQTPALSQAPATAPSTLVHSLSRLHIPRSSKLLVVVHSLGRTLRMPIVPRKLVTARYVKMWLRKFSKNILV